MLVSDVMTRDVVSAAPETPLDEAADTLVRRRLRAIPVTDGEGHVVGMLTDRQVMTHFLPGLEDPAAGRPDRPDVIREGTVRDVMERTVMCVNESEPLGDVVRLMLDKEIERLPVVSDSRLVGFLTRGDIIRRLLGDSREDSRRNEIIQETIDD
ncbi:MAG: CBS domain-containing protein [Gemmatimonadota bacterium]|nr:CBS domain-containing protein [Gemmatimonadota bacterium]